MEMFNDEIEITGAVKTGEGEFETVWTMPRNSHTNDAAGALTRNGTYCPDIVKVELNGPATIVYFQDRTKSVVVCQPEDKYNVEAAICQAIVKRLVGKVDANGLVHDGGTAAWLRRTVKGAVDQVEKAEQTQREKAKLKDANIARAKANREKAEKRRAKAEELGRNVSALGDLVKALPDLVKLLDALASGDKKTCACAGKRETHEPAEDPATEYVKPDKKFKDFTQDEKRAYWREQKRMSRNKA